MEVLLDLVVTFLETIVLYLICDIFLERRWDKIWKYILYISLQTLCIHVFSDFMERFDIPYVMMLKIGLEIFILLFFVSVSYRGTLWKKIFCVASFLACDLILDCVGLFIVYLWNMDIISTFTGEAVVSLLDKGIECLIIFMLHQIYGKRKYGIQINRRIWLQFLVFPIMTIFIMTEFLVENRWQGNSFIITSIVLLLSNFWLYFLLARMLTKEEENRELLRQREQEKKQAELYDSLQNSYFEQWERAHEFQEYLGQIQFMLKQGQVVDAEHYMELINGKIENQQKYYNTSNAIIDALINEKYRQAQKEGIVLSLKLADLSKIHIHEEELIYIFSFILDGVLNICKTLECKLASVFMEKREEEWQIIANISSEDRTFEEIDQEVWEKEMTNPEVIVKILEQRGGEAFCYSSKNSLIYQVSFNEEE